MADTIRIKRSAVPGKEPLSSDLNLGELAINTHDGHLFLKKESEDVIRALTIEDRFQTTKEISSVDYTLVAEDSWKYLITEDVETITIPRDTFPLGTEISGISPASNINFEGAVGVSLEGETTIHLNSVWTIKQEAENVWRVIGLPKDFRFQPPVELPFEDYDLVRADEGSYLIFTSTTSLQINIPADVFELGTEISGVAKNVDAVFVAGTGVTIEGPNTSLAGSVWTIKQEEENVWRVIGSTEDMLPIRAIEGLEYALGEGMRAYTYDPQGIEADVFDRSNHTGSQAISTITGLQAALDGKVNIEAGKGLSTEDFTSSEKTKLAGIADNATANDSDANLKNRANHTGSQDISTITGLQTALNNKVDSEVGKGLSTNDYTTAEKNKLTGIEAGATANATDAQLRARSTHTGTQAISTIAGLQDELDDKVVKVPGQGLSQNSFTNAEKAKLSGIETGATANDTDEQLRARDTHTGTQAISTVAGLQAALDGKVNTETGKGLSSNDFTTAEKNKLAGLEGTHWRGTFTSLSALNSGVSDPVAGDYADVDTAGADVLRYIWDASDSTWVAQSGVSAPITASQVKQLYESNSDTNAFTDSEKSKLSGIAAGAQVNVPTNIGQGTRTSTGIPLTSSTGSGTTLPVATTSLAGLQSSADKTKLDGIAAGATANDTDANLKNRANHTGTQAISTVSGLQDALDSKVNTQTGMGLSQNSFTNAEKSKLSGIEAGATADQTKADIDALGIDAATVNGFTVGKSVPANAVFTDTTYSVGNGGLTQVNFTSTRRDNLDAAYGWGNHADAGYALLADILTFQKPKEIASSEYTLAEEDFEKYLIFSSIAPLAVTIPADLFELGTEISGVSLATNTVLVADTGVDIEGYLEFPAESVWTIKLEAENKWRTIGAKDLNIEDIAGLESALNSKVDTETGMGLSQNSFTNAEKTKLSGIATGATANQTDAYLRNRANHTGSQAISTVTGLQNELDGKVGTSDARLTNSREWTAAVVGQTEAETGTATTARKWTAQRVRQAILGWWNNSSDKSKLDGIATGATANDTDANLKNRANHTGSQAIGTVTGLQTALDGKVDTATGMGLSQNSYTTTEKNKLAGIAAGATANDTDANLKNRANHTGSQAISTVTGLQSALEGKVDTETGKGLSSNDFTSAEKTKLSGIATGATANATDAQLRARSSHTGTQAISTVTGLQSALDGKVGTGDSRLTNSREWTASVVSQSEAEAGTATTARKWTAQRVRQAAVAAMGALGEMASLARASVANIRAFSGDTGVTAARLGEAADFITPSGNANWAPPWDSFISAHWEITGDLTLMNPTGVIPGTTRTIWVTSNEDVLLSFGALYSPMGGSFPPTVVTAAAGLRVILESSPTGQVYVSISEFSL